MALDCSSSGSLLSYYFYMYVTLSAGFGSLSVAIGVMESGSTGKFGNAGTFSGSGSTGKFGTAGTGSATAGARIGVCVSFLNRP